MENVKTVSLTQSVAVAVLGSNAARKGYKIENLHESNPVLVRGYAAPVSATVAGVKHISFSRTPTGGTFKVRFTDLATGATVTTTALAAGASNGSVQTALRLLAGYGSVTVANPDSGILGYKITLTGAPVPEAALSIVDSTLEVAGTAEVQTMTLVNGPGSDTPASGTFKIRWRDLLGKVEQVFETPSIAYNASVSAIQAILRILFNDNALTVTGTAWVNTRVLTFGNKRPMQNVEVISNMRNAGDAETQTISFDVEPESGSFKLSFNGVKSSAIAFSASNSAVQTALRTIAALSAVTVSGNFASGFVVTFTGVTGNPPLLVVTDNSLAVAEVNEVQTVSFSAPPEAGHYKLKYGATKSAFIDFDDDNAAVETALQGITALSSVIVTGNTTDGFEVEFDGVVGDASLLEVTDSTLVIANVSAVQTISWPKFLLDSGQYKLQYSGTKSSFIDFADDAAAVQVALRTVPALAGVTVAALSDPSDDGFVITFAGVVGAAAALVVTDNTLEDSGSTPVVPTVTSNTTGTSTTVTAEVTEDTPGTDVEVSVSAAETAAGGVKVVTVSTAKTTPGVAAVPVTAEAVLTTKGDLKALATSVAGTTTLDKSTSELKTPVYCLAEGTGVSVKVTEVF